MVVLVVASSRSPAGGVALLLAASLLLLACTATGGEAATDNSSTICDTAKCGKGTCSEEPGIFPFTITYKCTCDPGWSQPTLFNLSIIDQAPCIIPNCSFDWSCYNFSFLLTPPGKISFTDPCVAIKCGPGGVCKKGKDYSYTCECQPGYSNLLNITAFPCMKDCAFGADCSKLGISPPAPPPMPSTAAPPPGSALSWRLLLQQLLSSLAILLLQVV